MPADVNWSGRLKEIKTFDAKNLMRSDFKPQRKIYFRKKLKKFFLDQEKVSKKLKFGSGSFQVIKSFIP